MSVMSGSAIRTATPPAAAPNASASKFEALFNREVSPELRKLAAEKPVDAIVFYNEAPGTGIKSALSALDSAEALPFGAQRKQLVYDSLQKIGSATLDANRPTLDALRNDGLVTGVDELWSMNAVRVRGANMDALKRLVGPNVRGIIADSIVAVPTLPDALDDAVKGATMVPSGKSEPAAKPGTTPAAEDPNAVYMDWGTNKMNAPAAWAQGITGAGIVIGSLDTGVITDHPGLKGSYRGTRADGTQDHDYNLWNGIEKGSKTPIDDVGHGTHTIGSAVGNDDRHLVGVAPDAKFIAARALGEKGGSMFALMAGMQWMMAPTDQAGKNPRADLAPDIVTNSWGGGPVSNPFLWSALRNWRRAGIVPVFASGNARTPNPAEVASPGLYQETITVGATDKDDSRAYFSMYGPSDYSTDKKPEVMAPGVRTYSTLPDGTFRDTFIIDGKEHPASGTSMATPHVAGAVALYMQAHPNAKYDEILGALKTSATEFSTPTDQKGYGRVQVDKLIQPGSIDKDAKLADPKRVTQLMESVKVAKVYGADKPGFNDVTKPPAAKPTKTTSKPPKK